MDLRNTPMEEQFSMLTFLNEHIKNTGTYLFQYLKTKKQYQISFVNSPAVVPKFIADTPMQCINDAVVYMADEYKKEKNIDFIDGYKGVKDNEFLKLKVANLEKEIEKLKEQSTYGTGGYWPSDDEDFTPLVSDDDFGKRVEEGRKEGRELAKKFKEKTKRERGRPSKKSKSNSVLNKQAETHLENLLTGEKRPLTSFDFDPPTKATTPIQKKTKSKNKRRHRFSEFQEYKEILRVHKGKNRLDRVMVNTADIKWWAEQNSAYYDIERRKAHKRLYNKEYQKSIKRVAALDVEKNKYGIVKADIISNMKSYLGDKYNQLSKPQYLKEWKKAKSRVWNKHYRHKDNK